MKDRALRQSAPRGQSRAALRGTNQSRQIHSEMMQELGPWFERLDKLISRPQYRTKLLLPPEIFAKLLEHSWLRVPGEEVKRGCGEVTEDRDPIQYWLRRGQADLRAHVLSASGAMDAQSVLLDVVCEAYAAADESVRRVFSAKDPLLSNRNAKAYRDGWRFGAALVLENLWPKGLSVQPAEIRAAR